MAKDKDIYKTFGLRLKELRKERKMLQKELAEKLGVQVSQLNKYEAGVHLPPADKLILLSELFDASLDYLLMGKDNDSALLSNNRVLERFTALQDCPKEDLETILKLIDALVIKRRVEGVLKPFQYQTI